MRRIVLVSAWLAIAVSGCTAPAPSATPAVAPSTRLSVPPTSTSSTGALPSTEPEPSAQPFPTASDVVLGAQTLYSSAPPFDIPFSFVIPDSGWRSAHLHGEFLDVMRFDVAGSSSPTRWVAWAHPTTIIGATSAEAADLDPASAAALIGSHLGVSASATAPMTFAGLTGVRADFVADLPNTHVFGGPAGNFGLEPAYTARIGFFEMADELLLVLSLAAPAEVEAAWQEAQPILESVTFP